MAYPGGGVCGGYSTSASSSTTDSTASSTNSEARTRSVILVKRPGSKLGFSLRGGREHGTGFFVTAVEQGTEAAKQGLMIGDQIIRINGYPVDDATHKEVLQLILGGQTTVNFKVKSVGMIPVKDNPEDELSWQIVEPHLPHHQTEIYNKGDMCDDSAIRCVSDVKMILRVPPRAKLGCGICKGPEWKPGVFVQFTKENSIARQAGLRPGDQILQCNNFVFQPETPFSEAVSVLRCSGVLELMVRKGAGLELFPGESSGYNSSASSIAGDNHPPRLAALSEESNGLSNTAVNGSERRSEQDHMKNVRTEYSNGCTVIHVGGDETDNKKIAEICMVSQQLETKTTTVFVEVHHSEEDSISNAQSEASTDILTNSSSVSSFTSSASSLSSAISQEIERRSKRPPGLMTPVKPFPNQTDKLIKNGLAKEKVEQHEQLMMEFKKAHRKMFSSSDSDTTLNEEREEKRLNEQKANSTVNGSKPNGALNGSKPNDISNGSKPNGLVNGSSKSNGIGSDVITNGKEAVDRLKSKRQAAPPPPPPLPVEEGVEKNKAAGKKPAPPPPPPSPPYCPTPDYDTVSLASTQGGGKQRSDVVDMQSLESFKLTNPSTVKPKPPQTYFPKGSEPHNGYSSTASTVALRDHSKPLVTIREYPGGKERKNPSKFDFLQQPPPPSANSDEPIACRFQNELSQTLSRAVTLSKIDEYHNEASHTHHNGNPSKGTIVTINVNPHAKNDSTKPFYLFPNGNSPNGIDNKKLSSLITTAANKNGIANGKAKSNGIETPQKNSVTFNFSHRGQEVRNGHGQKNGILKNGNNNNNNISHVQIASQMSTDKMGIQKSIKFGGV